MSDDPLKMLFRAMHAPRRRPQTFRLGGPVRVLSGPFASFTGTVEGINQAKRLLKVRVEVFGREAPLRLGFTDAEVVEPPHGE